MADEIRMTGSLVYDDSESDKVPLQVLDFLRTIVTKRYTRMKVSVGIVEEAVNLGEITAPSYAIFVNRDSTNFIELRVATAAAKFARLDPGGGFAILRLGSGAQAPFAIADTAVCQMEYLVLDT